jgi:ATP-binding cassette subfamily B protein
VRDLASSTPKMLDILLYNFLTVILSLFFAFFTLLLTHKFFAFALLIWAIIFTLIALRGAKTASQMSSGIADQQTKIMGNLVDVLSNISNVKFFSRRNFEQKRIADSENNYTKLVEKRGWFFVKFFTLQGFTFCIYYTFCIVALIQLYSQNLVTLGDFLLIFSISNWTIHSMWLAANEARNFLEHVGTVNQALQILNAPLEIKDGGRELCVNKGEITFENVEFGYKNSAPLFSGKNIVIKPGEKIGLVGHSGGGKTTFAKLFLPEYAHCPNFVNADLIAQGLAPFEPRTAASPWHLIPVVWMRWVSFFLIKAQSL